MKVGFIAHVCVIFFTAQALADQHKRIYNLRSHAGILASVNVRSVAQCVILCRETRGCNSFNVGPMAADGGRICEPVASDDCTASSHQEDDAWRFFTSND